jgi:putative RNA 2'-phosphotransferase
MRKSLINISKTISYALRHNPQEFGLVLDDQGWTSVDKLLSSLQSRKSSKDITLEDIESIVSSDDKKRYELKEGMIRAVYGHSIDKKIEKAGTKPPEILYHGTTGSAADSILKQGLKPMSRQYVHLSEDIDTATMVAKRRTSSPIILKVKAKEAFAAGVFFSKETNGIWLSNNISEKFIIK